MISYFEKNYPNIKITLQQYSFGELIQSLYQKESDLAISYDFHLKEKRSIEKRFFMEYHPAWAIPVTNPLSQKENIHYSDMKQEQLVIVSEQDCPEGVQMVADLCEQNGGFYPNFYFLENMDTVYLWLKSSDKCALLNWESSLTASGQVKFFTCLEEKQSQIVYAGWLKDNANFSLELLREYLMQQSHGQKNHIL